MSVSSRLALLFLLLQTALAQTVSPHRPDTDTIVLLSFDSVSDDGVIPDAGNLTDGFLLEPPGVPTALTEGQDGFGKALAVGTGGVICSAPLPKELNPAKSYSELTVEAQVFLDRKLNGVSYFFSIGQRGSPGTVLGVYFTSISEMHIVRYDEGWQDDAIELTEPLPMQEWAHLLLVVKAGGAGKRWTFRVYLNGRNIGETESDFGFGAAIPDLHIFVGSCGSDETGFPGLIDNFRLSSVARLP